jgi:hypothetical protein
VLSAIGGCVASLRASMAGGATPCGGVSPSNGGRAPAGGVGHGTPKQVPLRKWEGLGSLSFI